MPPTPKNDFKLTDLLSLQSIRANSQITLEKDVMSELGTKVGDKVLLYTGPWKNSVVIVSIAQDEEDFD